ncbi:MAG TPA: CHC2 zinc finger domain-containing protein, partial [Thermoanaerobaculia bacterium]|nr:CHC2 zinc finger domain-containing protein [Thermoanaerobaculia bacterium]
GKAPDDSTDSPKMLYEPSGVSAELYGWESLRKQPAFVIVCEGEYDRLVLEAHGFPAVTGTSGAGVFKEEWAKELRTLPSVYVCFDNDQAGCTGAERVARLTGARIITLPADVGESGDVTDFFVRLKRTRGDFLTLLNEARPLPAASDRQSGQPRRANGRAAPSDIARLKQAVRIEDVVSHYVPLRPSGRALMARCCFHDDHQPSLAVFPETQSFYCFGCQKHGDVITFLMAVERLTFPEVLGVLKQLANSP